jgi:eukaryotic-like serine/threonine-protein kinase
MVTALHPGARFAKRYEVVRCIDLGGMGAIYEVIHLETRRRRALKLMLPSVVENEDLRRRFKLEATVAAEVESEHIVETFDAGIDDETGAPFLVMELLRGVDLSVIVKRLKKLAPRDALLILRQVALGLDKTHAAGIIHRDLKPENLFVSERDDGSLRIKILDFGIAKVVADVTHPAKTKVMGTPLYMAPEQLTGDGRVTATADRYALAMMAFTLLVGRAYWKDEADAAESIFSFLLQVMKGHPEPATARAARLGTDLPKGFDAWFERAAAKEPTERFETSVEQIEALAEAFPSEANAGVSQRFRDAYDEKVGPGRGDTPSRPRPAEIATEVETKLGSALTQEPYTSDTRASGGPSRTRRLGLGVALGAAAGAIVVALATLGGSRLEGRNAPAAAPPSASEAPASGEVVTPTATPVEDDRASPREEPDLAGASSPETSADAAPAPTASPSPAPPVKHWAPPKPSPATPPPPPEPVDPLKIR